MKKNKVFVAYIATLLCTGAVLSSDFAEDSASLTGNSGHVVFDASIDVTPKKVVVNLDEASYVLTPQTAANIMEMRQELLDTPGLSAQVDSEYSGVQIPQRHLAVKKSLSLAAKKEERRKAREKISKLAQQNQVKYAEEEKKMKLLRSAKKSVAEHSAVEKQLKDLISKQSIEVIQLRERCAEGTSSVSNLEQRVAQYMEDIKTLNAQKDEVASGDDLLFAQLTEKLTALTVECDSSQRALLAEKANADKLRSELNHKTESLEANKRREAELLERLTKTLSSGVVLAAEFKDDSPDGDENSRKGSDEYESQDEGDGAYDDEEDAALLSDDDVEKG